jgi:threonine aldolase
VDGARLANAAAFLGVSLRESTTGCGVDVVSFGGTKNGLLFGDAVVFLRPELADGFEFVRKQLGQLASKMRFLSAQFDALLAGGLWLENARNANDMAARLAAAVRGLPGLEIVHPVEANGVFAVLPRDAIDKLLAELPGEPPFHVWDEQRNVVRWMCAWDTTAGDVDEFAAAVERALSA